MKFLLNLSQLYVPRWMKKKYLQQLFDLTADAFKDKAPSITGLTFEEGLLQYAEFTKMQTEKAILGHECQNIKKRLHNNAFLFGQELRKSFHLTTPLEVLTACKIIYRLIGIDFEGDSKGKILIKQCFFSRYYSPEVCGLIFSLDEGVVGGISGGGKLSFQQRITEGKDCCRGQIDLQESG